MADKVNLDPVIDNVYPYLVVDIGPLDLVTVHPDPVTDHVHSVDASAHTCAYAVADTDSAHTCTEAVADTDSTHTYFVADTDNANAYPVAGHVFDVIHLLPVEVASLEQCYFPW